MATAPAAELQTPSSPPASHECTLDESTQSNLCTGARAPDAILAFALLAAWLLLDAVGPVHLVRWSLGTIPF